MREESRTFFTEDPTPWARGKADVLYVAHAFEVMTQVNALLAAGESKT